MSYQSSRYGHLAEVRRSLTFYESTSGGTAVAFTALPQAALVISNIKYAHVKMGSVWIYKFYVAM
jgi:hypothetical protein